jgi:amidase
LRRFAAAFLATVGLLACTSAAKADPVLDLENLSGAQAEQMLQSGQVTSVQLVRAYLTRIAALNKAGPGLNAVTQINPEALQQAADSDYARAHGKDLGPAMGLPILLKDIIDATPMYTSAGDWALRNSFPPNDSGVAKELKAHGVIVLGKLRPLRVGQQLRQPAVGLQQPHRPGAQRQRRRAGPERVVFRFRRGG